MIAALEFRSWTCYRGLQSQSEEAPARLSRPVPYSLSHCHQTYWFVLNALFIIHIFASVYCIICFFFFFWGMTHNGTMYMQWHKFMGLRCNDKMTCLVLQESFSVFWFCRTLCKSDSWFLGIFYVILHTCRCGHNWECSGRGWGVGHRHNHIPGNYLACYGRIGFYGFSSKHWDKVCSQVENFRYNLANTVKFHTSTIHHILWKLSPFSSLTLELGWKNKKTFLNKLRCN